MSLRFPWQGASQTVATNDNQNDENKDVSLDDLLPTIADRVQLVLLIVLCADEMRDRFTATFTDTNSDRTTATRNGETSAQSQFRSPLEQAGLTSFSAWRKRALTRICQALFLQPNAVKEAKARRSNTGLQESPVSQGSNNLDQNYRFRKIQSPIADFDEKKRALVLNSCLFILMSLESYSAYSSVLLTHLCYCLGLPLDFLRSSESTLALTLINSADMNADAARQKRADENAWSRKWKVGLATVAGAALVGVTGGLAAPILLGAAGAIMGGVGLGGLATLLGATIANPITIAAIFGAFGGRMTGNAMDKYSKDVEDFKFVQLRDGDPNVSSRSDLPHTSHKLRIVIGISGYLLEDTDVADPWRIFQNDVVDLFALQYERHALKDFGTMFMDVLRDSAYSLAHAGALKLALPAVSVAMAPLMMLQFGRLLDNPFTVAMERSDKAGRVLAAALMEKAQGERPVTLVAYSFGARVIYSCLLELAANRAFGLIESVVLAGAPVPSDSDQWKIIRSMVVGRVINVYSSNDLILAYLYRTRNAQINIAGLQEIVNVSGIENLDASNLIAGHNQYRLGVGRILQELKFSDIDQIQVDKENAELQAEDANEKAIHLKAKQEGRLKGQEDDEGRIIMMDISSMDSEPETHHTFPEPASKTTIAPPPSYARAAQTSQPPVATQPEDETATEESEEDELTNQVQMINLDPVAISESEPEAAVVTKKKRGRREKKVRTKSPRRRKSERRRSERP